MTLQIFRLKNKPGPWGDYGSILINGMTRHLSREGDMLQLERTGPYIPSVTMPGIHDLVLTDLAKQTVSQLLPSLQFRPVEKVHIVYSNWHEWDCKSEEPLVYPDTGEPEDYILEQPHDPIVASELGDIWEVIADIVPGIQGDNLVFNKAQYAGQHFICADDFGGSGYISKELKSTLEYLNPEWITFEEADIL
jgi:hypothetical protein